MAGPRAPIGSLSQHSDKAAQLARKPANASAARAAATKSQARKSTDDSDSDSSSGGSDSDSDSGAETKPTTNWAEMLKSKTPTKTTINGISSSSSPQPASALKKVVKKSSGSDTSSTSSSDADSDSESEKKPTKVDTKATTKSKAVAKPDADSGSESESESEDEDESDAEEDIKPKGKTATAAPTKAKPAADKTSSDESDGDSSDDESDSGAKVANKEDDSASEDEESGSGSSSESDSESEAEPKKTTKPIQAVVQKAKAKAAESSDESSDESSGEDSEGGSESDEDDDQSKAVAKRNGKSTGNLPEAIVPGFALRQAGPEAADAAQVAKLFRDAKAEGKQIWYFTAPASLPIEVIQEHAIPLENLRTGTPVLSHNGKDFCASADADCAYAINVMIPNKAGEHYGSSKIAVDNTVHITHAMRFNQDGSLEYDKLTTAATTTNRGLRPQPMGMKIRNQPLGVTNLLPGQMGPSNGAQSDEDVEMSLAPPLPSATPKAVGKKRKHGVVEDATPGKGSAEPASTKKSKKVRIDETPGVAASQKKPTKQTPIAPPAIPALNGGSSRLNTKAASSPIVPRKKATSNQNLPSTQPAKANGTAPKKVTPIPAPALPGRAGSSKP
ncbi:DNA-directed RNA polymerase I subunit RPA34.5-domain-containing protein [Podospora conica]|nr:DNA-directed RNA polymerase I subunit RPA34.5-domain-containing protein [Schizothecium conicum]